MLNKAGGVVLNKDGKIAIVKNSGRFGEYWSLPMGRVDENEDVFDCALREIREETGLVNLELVKKLGSYNRKGMDYDNGEPKEVPKKITLFLFNTNEMELKPVDPDNPEAKWVTIDEAINLMRHEGDKEFLRSVKDKI
ncbi:MAG: NUDIX hydrolase [Candidatus Colwellbacteria bacterium]|nr:NUDIX hydrolase [Candidatus Colwellbacteria bacterium]